MSDLNSVALALKNRGYETHVFATAAEAAAFVLSDIPQGETVAFGGSVTVRELGLPDRLRQAGHPVLWHWEPGEQSAAAVREQAMTAPHYICSANALTESGLIVQIDGTGNRVAAQCYGPKNTYLIIGKNKLAAGGYAQAVARIKQIACPLNARRLGLDTPCAKEDKCNSALCTKSMCSFTLAIERAPAGRRMIAVLVDENLGY